MNNQQNRADKKAQVVPGSDEEMHFAEKGYVVLGGRPKCGICFAYYGDDHEKGCVYGA